MKKILFAILLMSLNYFVVEAQQVVIKIKINDNIITNIDIQKEMKYLTALNSQLKKLDKNQVKLIAIDSITNETIKKIELEKYPEIKTENPNTQSIINNLYKILNLNTKEELQSYLLKSGLSLDFIRAKINIENNWNQIIYTKYRSQVNIDMELINDEVKNLKSISKEKKLLLSEIFFFQDSSISIEEKSKKIIESINEIGFKNTANIYSSSDSAKLGGNIGWVEEKELSKIILTELNKIDVGQITRPIKLDNNFLILKIEDIKTESSSFNEKQLTNKILQNETDRQLKLFSRNYFNRVKINLNISEI
jgi:peptidyl-prolyl cis-trans isomerase SurA